MGNHELSPLDALCVAPVYTAAWAQEHASSETCLMASSYRKDVCTTRVDSWEASSSR